MIDYNQSKGKNENYSMISRLYQHDSLIAVMNRMNIG